jgi:hypothetical protein
LAEATKRIFQRLKQATKGGKEFYVIKKSAAQEEVISHGETFSGFRK